MLSKQFCNALTVGTEDRQAATLTLNHQVVARLRDPAPIRGLSDAARAKFLAGAHFALGVREAYRVDTRALEAANALEGMGPTASFQADQVRALYFGIRGDRAGAVEYERRIDLMAIQVVRRGRPRSGFRCVRFASRC